MTHRTDTRQQTVFHHSAQGVTLEFVKPGKIKFALAAGRSWSSPLHWHTLHQGCQKVTCLQGRLCLASGKPDGGSAIDFFGPDSSRDIRFGDVHTWTSDHEEQDLVALLETEDTLLYRNVSSATLDATRYPFLTSTPYWVWLLYSALGFSPNAQRILIDRFLWIQLQTIYFSQDFWMNHGRIHAPLLWFITHPLSFLDKPPNWVFTVQWWSIRVISKATQRACYWFGRLFLGMKDQYPEYTPRTRSNDLQSIEKAIDVDDKSVD